MAAFNYSTFKNEKVARQILNCSTVDLNIESACASTALDYTITYCYPDMAIEIIDRCNIILNDDMIDNLYDNNLDTVIKHVRCKYITEIMKTVNDKNDTDNILSHSFRTTYVPQLADMICEFII